ncbi:hypothetical protein [Mycolicibacterium sp. XJ1819]
MAKRVPVPTDVVSMNLLNRVDYEDSFAKDTTVMQSAEDWARLCLEQEPPASLKAALLILAPFRARTDKQDGATIAGMRVIDNSPEHIVLGFGAKSWTPRIVFSAQHGQLWMSTLIEFGGTAGRVGWGLISPMHRNTAKSLVDHAVKTAARRLDGPR